MAEQTESILAVILLSSSAYLIWQILRFRQRRAIFNSIGEAKYDGKARNPDSLLNPDDNTLNEMGRLLGWEEGSEE